MAPKYEEFGGFTVNDALAQAGAPTYEGEFYLGEPPVEFFTQPPENAEAVFSTVGGNRIFRSVPNPTFERDGYYWWAAEIQRVCDELRRNLPQVCKDIEEPQTYWDLYKYFDAYDIYYRGAQNLWNVIKTLLFENQYAKSLVDEEQKLQAQEQTPLFEFLAAEVLKKPEMQAKLLTWDKEKQQDILKVFTSADLQIFDGYEHYHEHFLDAIRSIFKRRYETLSQGIPFFPWPASIDGRVPATERDTKRLVSVRLGLLDDPFMDKFDIPNRISNGIVIADGTSQTAALRARQQDAVSPSGNTAQPADMNRSLMGDNNNSILHPKAAITNHPVSITERCVSAPSIGGDPASILGQHSSGEARVYPGDSHEVDKKLFGCEKPDDSKDANGYAPGTTGALEMAIPASDANVRQYPSAPNQALPLMRGPRSFSQYNNNRPPPSMLSPILSSAYDSSLGPVSSSRPPQTRTRGMSQAAFVNQVPVYLQSRQIMPAPQSQPPMMRQMQHAPPAPPAYMQSNSGRNSINSIASQQKGSFSSGYSSGGRWQHVGADDIHGPKVVFRKGSVHDHEGPNRGAGQWQSQEPNDAGRRTSIASTNTSYRRFSNARPYDYVNLPAPTTGGYIWAPAMSDSNCVNAFKPLNVNTKFDACSCSRCREKDRSIFVGRLRDRRIGPFAIERLKQHFCRYGEIECVEPGSYSVHIRYRNSASAIAAVQAAPRVNMKELAESFLKVNYVLGSQYFKPLPVRSTTNGPNNQSFFAQNDLQNQRRPSIPQSTQGPNNFKHARAPSFQSRGAPYGGPDFAPGARAFAGNPFESNPDAAGATQFGADKNEASRSSHSDVLNWPPWPVDTAQSAPQDGSNLDEERPQGTAQSLVKSITDLTHIMTALRRSSNCDTQSKVVQTDNNTPAAEVASTDVPVDPAQVTEGKSEGDSDEASVDYGTVRIRRGGAKNKASLPEWLRSSPSDHAVDEYQPQSQTLPGGSPSQVSDNNGTPQISQPLVSLDESGQQIPIEEHGDITGKSQLESSQSKSPSDHEHPSELHDNNPQDRANEAAGDNGTPSQSSPENELAKVQPSESLQQPGTPPTENLHDAEPTGASQQNLKTPRLPSPIYVHVPLTRPSISSPSESEPFPAYRDLMSGPQPSTGRRKGHAKGSGQTRSTSSIASTATLGRKGPWGLSKGTENANPTPTLDSAMDPALMPAALPPTYTRGGPGPYFNTRGPTRNAGPKPGPQQKKKSVDESKKAKKKNFNSPGSGDAFQAKDGGRDSTGAESGDARKGKGKSKGKRRRHDRENADSGRFTNGGCRAPDDLKETKALDGNEEHGPGFKTGMLGSANEKEVVSEKGSVAWGMTPSGEGIKENGNVVTPEKTSAVKDESPSSKEVKAEKLGSGDGKGKEVVTPDKTSAVKVESPPSREVKAEKLGSGDEKGKEVVTPDQTSAVKVESPPSREVKAEKRDSGDEKGKEVVTSDKTSAVKVESPASKEVKAEKQEKRDGKGKKVVTPDKNSTIKDESPSPNDVKADKAVGLSGNGNRKEVAVPKNASSIKGVSPRTKDVKDVKTEKRESGDENGKEVVVPEKSSTIKDESPRPKDVKIEKENKDGKGKQVVVPEKTPAVKNVSPPKDAKTDKQEEGNANGKVVVSEKTSTVKDTTPATSKAKATETKPEKSIPQGSSPGTDTGTPSSTPSTTSTQSKTKPRKSKKRPGPKKTDTSVQTPDKTALTPNMTPKSTEPSPLQQPKQEPAKGPKSPPKPSASSSPPAPAPRAKPALALAPIPLYDRVPSAWKRVGSAASGGSSSGGGEKTPPFGERKGG